MKRGSRQASRLLMALGAIVGVALVLNLLLSQPEETGSQTGLPRGSTYSTAIDGAELVYRLYEDVGFDVERHQYPLTSGFIEGDEIDVLWHMKGRIYIGRDELDWIDHWVTEGGTLVIVNEPDERAETGYEGLPATGGDELLNRWLERFGLEENLSEVLNISARGRSRDRKLLAGGGVQMALGEMGSVATYERLFLSEPRVTRFTHYRDVKRDFERVMSDSHGLVLGRGVWGQGQVWFVADSYLFSNLLLQEADNAPVAVSMIIESRGGEESRILFDEYHLGFVQTRTFGDATRTPVGKALIYLGLIAALAIGTAGARFGRSRYAPAPVGVSQRAFVRALAGMWQAAGATTAAADALWRRYRGKSGAKSKELENELDAMRKGRPKTEELLNVARKLDG